MIFLLLCLSFHLATATDWLEKKRIHDILAAKSATDLEKRIDLYQDLKILNSNCQSDLKTGDFPQSCYFLLEKQKKLGIRDAQLKVDREVLDSLCLKYEIKNKTSSSQQRALRLASPNCQRHMRSQICRFYYRVSDNDPQSLFAWSRSQCKAFTN